MKYVCPVKKDGKTVEILEAENARGIAFQLFEKGYTHSGGYEFSNNYDDMLVPKHDISSQPVEE